MTSALAIWAAANRRETSAMRRVITERLPAIGGMPTYCKGLPTAHSEQVNHPETAQLIASVEEDSGYRVTIDSNNGYLGKRAPLRQQGGLLACLGAL